MVIIPGILTDCGIKLEINGKEKINSNTWRLNNTLLNDHWVIE
jgi:hypothetical protein